MQISSSLKGFYGEQEIKNILLELKPYGVKFIEDAAIPTQKGVTQIDFIVFSRAMLACLEVKAWQGKIYVPDIGEHWKVVYNRQIITPTDPYSQNNLHCKAASNCSPNFIKYTNLLVFPTNPVIINKKSFICTPIDLIDKLTSSNIKYSDEIVNNEYECLLEISNENYDKLLEKEFGRCLDMQGTTSLFD